LDEEVRGIDRALRLAEFRDRFDIRQHWAVRYGDLQELFLRHRPDIVHFSGHGSAASEIILATEAGGSHPVSSRALSALFSVLKDNIRCVVLNACYSEPQAQAIAQHIDAVVGMTNQIGDEAAINFAAAFYQALGFGRSVQTAFDLGRLQLDLANLGEQDTPKLLAANRDPAQIIFAAETPQPEGRGVGGDKYNVTVHDARGVAIGDNAQVTQHFSSQVDTGGGPYVAGDLNVAGDYVGRDKTVGGPGGGPGAGQTAEVRRTALQSELQQHQRNLSRLQAQKAVYARGEEPLRLLNQIDHEEQEIERIQMELQGAS
jgi:hypothetical protein